MGHRSADASLKNEKGDIPSRDYTKVVWAGITGSQDANSETTAEDRIQVMFVGTQLQYVNKPGYKDQSKKIPYPMGFTDFLDKPSIWKTADIRIFMTHGR